jgi:hypothetical protein
MICRLRKVESKRSYISVHAIYGSINFCDHNINEFCDGGGFPADDQEIEGLKGDSNQ